MSFIERILRAMTQLNIGATIATAIWTLWSGFAVVAAPVKPTSEPPSRSPATPAQLHECPCAKPGDALQTRSAPTPLIAATAHARRPG